MMLNSNSQRRASGEKGKTAKIHNRNVDITSSVLGADTGRRLNFSMIHKYVKIYT